MKAMLGTEGRILRTEGRIDRLATRAGTPAPKRRRQELPVRLSLAAALAALALLALPAAAHALEQKLVAADGALGDNLGVAVAVDGDTAVVGAGSDDVGANVNQGAVYVFTRSGDSWTETAKLTASDGAANDRLGSSVAIDGDTIVAGALTDDVGANPEQGSTYTFARTGAAARTETAKLTASDGAAADRLGQSVAIDGDTIVAGAGRGSVFQGSVYTFARTGAAARTETAKLTASDGTGGDQLGFSVAIDGDTIVAGAPIGDGGTVSQGSAYTFARTGAAARTETAKLTASDGAEGDVLGSSVAIDADTIVAGAPGDDVGANENQGSAYTFARTGAAARTETAKLTASDGVEAGRLGQSVAIDGDTIVAGAPGDGVGANFFQGSAYTFARTGAAARTETAKLTASDGAAEDRLGSSVAIDADTIVAGAPDDDVGANVSQGSASIFFPPSGPPEDFDNAAKQCRAERESDPAGFQETWGTNAPRGEKSKGAKRNAFGKCVSATAKEADDEEGPPTS